MPKWGLTVEQRDSQPWKLSAGLLGPGKTITDPVHGDIYLTRLETQVVNSAPMQRLRRVRQLGTTYLVYPGATHTRFSHSLGALRVAQDILDQVLDQRNGPDPVVDIFSEWASNSESYARKIAEVTVLARLGALLHDLCHVPYGHSVEDELKILVAHDENTQRFETLWLALPEQIRNELEAGGLAAALRPMILSKEKLADDTHIQASLVLGNYAFVADIVGNTICADLLDYLARDHAFTGLPAKLGTRVLAGFYVTPSSHSYHPARMAMRITRRGRVRDDVVSELFKYLRYRYELSERALAHHAKIGADAMIGKTLELWREIEWLESAGASGARDSDARARLERDGKSEEIARVDSEVTQKFEAVFIRYSDDGLLEHLRDRSERGDVRWNAIGHLVNGLLDRRLYKPLGVSRSARAQADTLADKYSVPSERRKLEEGAATFVGVPAHWISLWVPPPQMRMKAAQVLVDNDGALSTLYQLDNTLQNRGEEIYRSHKALWALSVYVDPEMHGDRRKCDVLLSYLADEIGIKWDHWSAKSIDVLAADEVAIELNLTQQDRLALTTLHAAYKGRTTYAEIVSEKKGIALTRRAPPEPLILQASEGSKKTTRKSQ
ncbi:MAG TPA: hypothetical protein VGI10_26250 [Polyangiaceae bacterium]|jgi:hypothetical protein